MLAWRIPAPPVRAIRIKFFRVNIEPSQLSFFIRNMRELSFFDLEDCWLEEQGVQESSLLFPVLMFMKRLTWGHKLLKSHPKRYVCDNDHSSAFFKDVWILNIFFRFWRRTQWLFSWMQSCTIKWRTQFMQLLMLMITVDPPDFLLQQLSGRVTNRVNF